MLGSGQLGGSPARPGGAQPEGKAAALGLYEDLLHCLMPGEAFVEYGVVEHRYESLRPEVFQRLVEDYSHTRLGRNKPFTASVFIALVLRRLAERGEVLQTVGQATGPWSHNEVISYWALPPGPEDPQARLTFAEYTGSTGSRATQGGPTSEAPRTPAGRRLPGGPRLGEVTGAELDRLGEACQSLPVVSYASEQHDYMTNVLLTVLDLRMHNVAVERSIRHYWDCRQDEIRTLDDLEALLARFPEGNEGNRRVARYLWGNNHWARALWLRGFVRFLADEDLRTREALEAWARRSDYERDFAGRVPYLGAAAYQWLVMRFGVETVPHLDRGPFCWEAVEEQTYGPTTMCPPAAFRFGSKMKSSPAGAPRGCRHNRNILAVSDACTHIM